MPVIGRGKVSAQRAFDPLRFDHAAPAAGVLGVVGGMGPGATADFYRKLVEATPAQRDQDHIPLVVLGDPRIADRSTALVNGDDAAVLEGMQRRVRFLEQIGVDAIAIPCNTAHYWLPQVKASAGVPFISIVEASIAEARTCCAAGGLVLVLGTRATAQAGVYLQSLREAGLSAAPVPGRVQAEVSEIIDLVKAGKVGEARSLFGALSPAWLELADVVLLACTELPIAAATAWDPKFIDTTAALARACVTWAANFRRHAPQPAGRP